MPTELPPQSQIVDKTSIDLDVVSKDGSRRGKVRLNATIIQPESKIEGRSEIAKRAFQEQPSPNVPVATELEDAGMFETYRDIQRPPYNLDWLSELPEISAELAKNVRAMVVNTVGFGYQLKRRRMSEEQANRFADDITAEYEMLSARLATIHPTDSFTTLLGQREYDRQAVGNGYLELIYSRAGNLVGIEHVHGHKVYISALDDEPVEIEIPYVMPSQDFAVKSNVAYHRFRRYAVRKDNGRLIWFKQAGDPRDLDKHTGEFSAPNTLPFNRRATSLLHRKVYSPRTPYGVPVYIGAAVDIAGDREAKEINFNSISNNMIPSMFVIIENGVLTEGSIARLKDWTENNIAHSKNRSAFIILEGETLEDGSPDAGKFHIKIEKMNSVQHEDMMYQQYGKNSRDEVRQSFRLPPIFVGRADDYTRATADTSRDIADEQVFAPERDENDYQINRYILMPLGARYHYFRSNHPNITDDIELIRMMGLAERSGGMTPRRANAIVEDVFGGEIGPMPEGIPLDVPYSFTFAQAQKAPNPADQQQGEQTGIPADEQKVSAKKLVKDLISLRNLVEKDLDPDNFGEDDV